jgi:ATP-dependent RNA helicase DeaD
MLQTIERVTKRRITIEKVPTIADLRARRLELTRAALEESILDDNLDNFRVVVETLTDEYDVMDVALAAVKLAHEASGAAADEEEIPEVSARAPREGRGRPEGGGREGGRYGGGREERRGRGPSSGMTRLFVSAGRSAGIRPQDLVGAIAGESRLSGRDIGSIEIADRFSLVEVPETAANDVISALRGATIKGKKATVRRERER